MSEINENELTDNLTSEEAAAVETVEETAAEEISEETVEEAAAEETASEEMTSEESENTEETEASEETENTEETEVSEETENNEIVQGTEKKTNAVLVGLVIILLSLVVIFAVLIISKIGASKVDNTDSADTSIEQVTKEDNSVNTVNNTQQNNGTDTAADSQNTSSGSSIRNYNIPVTLGQYKGIEVSAVTFTVEESEIDSELDALIGDYAYEEEITDRAVREGDLVEISYVGRKDGIPFDGGTGSKSFTLGQGSFIPGFEDEIVGMNAGETKSFDITFPENYGSAELAGVEVTFEVTLNSMSQEKYPELTDEFIAENTDHETIADYREYIRGYITEEKQEQAHEEEKYNITMKLIETSEFGGDIDRAVDDATEEYIQYYDYMASSLYGIDGATFFMYIYGYDEEAYHTLLRSQAEYAIKLDNALKAIAREEKLEATPEEFEKEFGEYFYDYYGYTSKEEVYEAVAQEDADKLINDNILCAKAEELLYSYSIIKE